jgi:DNA polymerase sigma
LQKNAVNIDILVNNVLGVINSEFLKVYSQIKWVRNLGILVKIWAKNKGIIGKNCLSSYSLILMLIHFLIKTKKVKPILDAR